VVNLFIFYLFWQDKIRELDRAVHNNKKFGLQKVNKFATTILKRFTAGANPIKYFGLVHFVCKITFETSEDVYYLENPK
jgi:hypothetical protein